MDIILPRNFDYFRAFLKIVSHIHSTIGFGLSIFIFLFLFKVDYDKSFLDLYGTTTAQTVGFKLTWKNNVFYSSC